MELRMEEVTKSFGKKQVLTGINATLSNGVYGMLGPNGAGKTTLIRILADISNPTGGKVYIDGRDKSSCGELYRILY